MGIPTVFIQHCKDYHSGRKGYERMAVLSGLGQKYLVDLQGFEPWTSSMPWKRAPNCATGPHCLRGDRSVDDCRPSNPQISVYNS